MSRYIDADELKKAFQHTEDAEYCRWTLSGVLGEIDDMPTADVQEVKRGLWIEEERPTCYVYRCTACGDEFDAPYNYCPNCGAKMDEVEE